MQTYPSIDCVFLNAAMQSVHDFSKPETVDLDSFHRTMTINFTAHVNLVHAFLPRLLKHNGPTGLIFTGTPVGFIPVFAIPAYSSSKAAFESFAIALREQLRDTNVKVTYISPGPVRTELHDLNMGKDSGTKLGMPLKDFVDQTYAEMVEGRADIYPGTVGGSTREQLLELMALRDEAFSRLSALIRNLFPK